MPRSYKLFLQDILEATHHIASFIEGKSKQEFAGNKMAVDAVVREIEIMGEAVINLPYDLKRQHREVPWRQIRAFRNMIVHQYWLVDIDVLWDVATVHVPPLAKPMKAILHEEK